MPSSTTGNRYPTEDVFIPPAGEMGKTAWLSGLGRQGEIMTNVRFREVDMNHIAVSGNCEVHIF